MFHYIPRARECGQRLVDSASMATRVGPTTAERLQSAASSCRPGPRRGARQGRWRGSGRRSGRPSSRASARKRGPTGAARSGPTVIRSRPAAGPGGRTGGLVPRQTSPARGPRCSTLSISASDQRTRPRWSQGRISGVTLRGATAAYEPPAHRAAARCGRGALGRTTRRLSSGPTWSGHA